MGKEKIKSISLAKLKIADSEEGKERRVTFVASSSNEDRDYESLDIGSFRLPKKGGGHLVVRDLPSEGSENVDIPFLTNHDLYAVEKTIGSVRKAMFVDGELIFEAGISSRDYAQDVFKLIEEGHLDNAFSIQFRDYEWNPEAKTISGGEIIEVSLVTRGSNKDAQVLEVKQVKGEEMATENIAKSADENAAVEATAEAPKVEDTPAVEPEQAQSEPTTEKESDTDDKENKEKGMTDLPDHKAKAADQVRMPGTMPKMPSQAATSYGDFDMAKDYLKSKGAVLEFAKLSKACGGDPASTEMAWKSMLKGKGITISDGSSFLPTEIEQVMFKAWHDAVGALATFRRTRARMTRFYAMTTSSRAMGHKKGNQKKDQDVVAIPRIANLHVIYKKLPIDWIDILNDESGELYVFRTRELTDRLMSEIVRGAIIGDGRSDDDAVFVKGEGLYSIAADINASGTPNTFASTVATKIANVSGDDTYAKIIKTMTAVRIEEGSGRRKVLVVKEGTMADMLLEKNENGGRLYPVGTNFREVFDVADIIEFPAADMEAVGLDVIVYATDSYTLGGPEATVRNWFDGNYNKDYMMVEQAVLGSLEGYHVAAGYASK